jgi:hypothetical protein
MILAIGLAACAKQAAPPPAAEAPPPKPAQEAPPEPAGKTPTVLPPEKPQPPPAASELLSEAQLIGLSEFGAGQLFGNPDRIEMEAPAMVWRYRTESCALALFFYMDLNAKAYRVLTYEVTPEDQKVETCAGALHERKIAGAS